MAAESFASLLVQMRVRSPFVTADDWLPGLPVYRSCRRFSSPINHFSSAVVFSTSFERVSLVPMTRSWTTSNSLSTPRVRPFADTLRPNAALIRLPPSSPFCAFSKAFWRYPGGRMSCFRMRLLVASVAPCRMLSSSCAKLSVLTVSINGLAAS